jgi:membrane associated rhomboid family serine protease
MRATCAAPRCSRPPRELHVGRVSEAFERRAREQEAFEQQLARLAPRSWIAPALVAINVAVFIAMALATGGDSILKPDGRVHAVWGSNFGPLTTDGEWWRLFSSMFLHFGIIHLLFNMIGLWDGGRLGEKLYGQAEFLLLYVVSGLAGSVASLLWHPEVNSAGASGAIFGVYGALLTFVLMPGNRVPSSTSAMLWVGTAAFLAYSLINGMAREGIDNAAHVGGLAAGVLMGLALARPMDASRAPGSDWRRVGIAALAAAVALPLLATQVRDVSGAYKRDQQYQADLKWLEAEEGELYKAFEQWRAKARAGTFPDRAIADGFEQDVARRWRAAHARMAANALAEGSRLRPHQALVLEYLELRAQSAELLVEAVRTGDRAKLNASNAKTEAGKQALERLKLLNRPKKSSGG